MNSADVVNASKLTYRQLDHAVRNGWLKPVQTALNEVKNGTGYQREWSTLECEIACVAARLIKVGFNTERAMKLARSALIEGSKMYLGLGIHLEIEINEKTAQSG